MKTLHFKSSEAYRKYLAYGNIHHVFKHKAPYAKVVLHGKPHKVLHVY